MENWQVTNWDFYFITLNDLTENISTIQPLNNMSLMRKLGAGTGKTSQTGETQRTGEPVRKVTLYTSLNTLMRSYFLHVTGIL